MRELDSHNTVRDAREFIIPRYEFPEFHNLAIVMKSVWRERERERKRDFKIKMKLIKYIWDAFCRSSGRLLPAKTFFFF